MGRRKKSILELLMALPWWVGFALAGAAYTGIAYGLPRLLGDGPSHVAIKALLPTIAILLSGVLAAGSALNIIRTILSRGLFNRSRNLASIRLLSWRQFEVIVAEYWRRRGYFVLETGGGGADGGFDLVLRRDSEKYLVQCKQWRARNVGVKPARELFGVMTSEGAAGGYLITSGSFTSEAREFARGKPLELVDGMALAAMVAEVNADISEAVAPPVLAPDAPSCPSCGAEMIRRVAKRGANAGSAFWGCSTYPRCRANRQAIVA